MPQIYRDNHATLSGLLERAGASTGATLLIPDLQRPYVWTPKQVIVLVDSLLRGWPFGSLLLWAVSQQQVAEMPSRQFAISIDRVDNASDQVPSKQQPADYQMVLDGQQRLQSLLLAFGGDSRGFKLLDREWHQVLHEKRPRGRASKHWSFGELCVDLQSLKSELDTKKRLAAVDFTDGALAWIVRSSTWQRSSLNRPKNYEDPLYAADDPAHVGRFVRLSRLWASAGDPGLLDSADFENAVGNLLMEHKTDDALSKAIKRSLEDLLRKLREVRDTRVTFLEVDKYDSKMGAEAIYMDAVVSIFTRLNTAGRTLSREEITFAWVKSGWHADKVGNRSATECFETLSKQLKDLGIDLTLDELMSGVAFIWSVVFNSGKVLSQRDLLNAKSIRPMAQQLSEVWTRLETSIRTTSEVIQQRGLEFGRHYLSLNSLAVLWAWGFLAEQWAREHSLQERPRDAWDKQLSETFGPTSDRWLICSQWAGYWGSSSAQRVADCATKLATLRTATDSIVDQGVAVSRFTETLASLVYDTENSANTFVDQLAVDDRNQVRQYYVPLWVWHRLNAHRWKNSAVPLRVGKKQPSLDVDHVVAVKIWEALPFLANDSAAKSDEDEPDLRQTMNDLGNCILLETAFNISKSDKSLANWLDEIYEFKSGKLSQQDWANSLGLTGVLLDPNKSSLQLVAGAIEARSKEIRTELKGFIVGKKTRADL
jgi:hypothetical protein